MEFVTFEIAKKLKEKGFRELCLAYYTNGDPLYYNYSHRAGACIKDCYLSHNLMPEDSVSGKFVDAPTISQVLKWLSDKKEVDLVIEPIFFFDKNRRREYNVRVFAPSLNKPIHCGYFNKREEAALVGIEYVLDNLI